MRTDIVNALSIGFIILAASIPLVIADNQILLSEESLTTLQPITFWNYTDPVSDYYRVAPKDICVSADGTVFAVNIVPGWELVRSMQVPASFGAWTSTGELLWIKRYRTWELMLFGVTTDDSHVFVTGQGAGGLFVGKYDLLGNSIWNYTDDFDTSDCGLRISVSEEGYIIVRASAAEFSENNPDACLVVLNSNGEYLWHKSFQDYAYVDCDSSFIYIMLDNAIEKYDMDGGIIWSAAIDEESRLTALNDMLFSYQGLGQIYESGLTIEGWNPHTGGRILSSTITLYDGGNQMFNLTHIECSSTQNESLVVLLSGPWNSTNRWRLLMIDNQGFPTGYFSILDASWRYALCEPINNGQLVVVGYSSETSLSMAIFDPIGPDPLYDLSISEPLDIYLIGTTLIGVIVFDASLIIILKKRYDE